MLVVHRFPLPLDVKFSLPFLMSFLVALLTALPMTSPQTEPVLHPEMRVLEWWAKNCDAMQLVVGGQ